MTCLGATRIESSAVPRPARWWSQRTKERKWRNDTVHTPTVDPAALTVPSAGAGPLASAGMAPGIFGESLLGTLAGRGVSNVAAKLRAASVVPRSPAAG
jgi:hypothetical protein